MRYSQRMLRFEWTKINVLQNVTFFVTNINSLNVVFKQF